MTRHVHVIGAGLAGLCAAVEAVRGGAQVSVYEAAPQAGGRCRSYFDRALNATIDNGNHLVLSGNRDTLAYLSHIGAADQLSGPDNAAFPFFDFASGARWTVQVGKGRLPFWIFDPKRRPPDVKTVDFIRLLRLLRARPSDALRDVLPCDGLLWQRLLHPLFLAVLNTDPAEGSAWLAANVVRETLMAGGNACRPLIAHNGLDRAFVAPALAWLQRHNATVQFGKRLRGLACTDTRIEALLFNDARTIVTEQDAIVLAVPPNVAQDMLPGLSAPTAYRAIVNLHYAVTPPASCAPLTGMLNSLCEWLFAFDGRLSVTISGADRLLDIDRAELAQRGWREVAAATGLPAEPLPPWQVVRERRATFAALPQEDARRPGTATAWRNLALAGDWTATGLPATIEGAIRSGKRAAHALCFPHP
jgi:squalene-associated FAD-dependent desaturase